MVAEAVPRNRSPTAKFPANREKNREFSKIWPPSRILARIAQINQLLIRKFPRELNRENNPRSRESLPSKAEY